MSVVDPEGFLEDQFPKKYWHHIPTTLRTAYAAAAELIASDPILQIESAIANRGRFISWATDFGFKRLLETHQLPFEFRWRPFSKPTGSYLEIRLSHSVVSISQISDPTKQPRNVRFRENGRLNNEPFFDLPEFADEHTVKGEPHFLLVHGYQELTFAHLALPHPLHNRNYRFRTTNLMSIPHELPSTGPAIEDTDVDFNATQLLKEDIERWRKDNGK
ncbi:hypothetical protein [Novispirillum itersonii]|uniref:hypothetical protein n=1 Tax=Novispirillum itersonii TaxID=189 RepID=UPI0012DF899C|nr:hypothetical protein [Novispirillum itersonii]